MREGNRLGALTIVAACALTLVAFCGIGASAALAAPPTVTLDPVTVHSITTAHATGEVSVDSEANGGFETSWCFESTLEGQEAWSQATCGGPVAPGASEPLAGDFTGLAAGKHYEARISYLNFNDFVTEYSAVQSFETDAAVAPVLGLDAPGTVSYTSAQISGTIDPEGGNEDTVAGLLPISWELQVSSDGGSSWNTAGSTSENPLEGANAESNSPVAVQAEATGLTPSTAYEFRLLAHYAGLTAETEEVDWGEFTTLAVAKPTITTPVVSALTATTAHFAAEVDPNGTDPAFDASWSFSCTPACFGLKGGIVSGSPDEVENDATDLQPNTEYTLKLSATNAGGSEEKTTTFKTPAVAPTVTAFGAGPVASDHATLNGQVNPHNSATTYWFEWGAADCSANPCTALPAGKDAGAGSGPIAVHVSEQLTGLNPGTTYHFRLVAKNSTGTIEGADQQFTTLATAEPACANEALRAEQHPTVELPNCRAWEQVSPANKNGGDVLAVTSHTHIAEDGSAAVFSSLAAFADARGTGVETEYMAQRTGAPGTSGWSAHAITPQQGPLAPAGASFGLAPLYDAEFSPDLDTAIYRYFGARPEDANVQNVANLYLRDDLRSSGAGSFQLLTDSFASLPFSPSTFFSRPYPAGTSADFSHVLFESVSKLTPGAGAGAAYKLYEWHEGAVRLAGILPDGTPLTSSTAGQSANIRHYTPHVISADGSRVFFTANGGKGDLYTRIDGKVSVQLNRSEKDSPESPSPARYWNATPDGTRAFFTTTEGLVEEDENGDVDLYMWKRAGQDEAQRLAVDADAGIFTLSFNGVATAPIAAGASAAEVQTALEGIKGPAPDELPLLPAGDVSISGGPGDAGATHPYDIAFHGDFAGVNVPELEADGSGLSGGAAIATLTTTDPIANLTLVSKDEFGADASVTRNLIGTSDDGRYVYFTASGKLLPDAGGNTEFAEGAGIYLWHDGALDYVGWLFNFGDVDFNSPGPTWDTVKNEMSSRVSPDGRHLLFASHADQGLAGRGGFPGADFGSKCSADPDQGGACRELFLYDADSGALRCASCHPGAPAAGDARTAFRASSGGTVLTSHFSHPLSDDGRYVFFATEDNLVPADTNGKIDVYEYDSQSEEQRLLSSATSDKDTYFMEASPSGRDVLFSTREPLVGWDTDESYDLYDARVNGGLPEPAARTAECEGESCRSGSAGAPGTATPGSASLTAPGNPKPNRCPKGKRAVRKNGKTRCVAKKHRKHNRTANTNRRVGR